MQNKQLLKLTPPKYIEANQDALVAPLLRFELHIDPDVTLNKQIIALFQKLIPSDDNPELPVTPKEPPNETALQLLTWIYTTCKTSNWSVFQIGNTETYHSSELSGTYTLPTQKNARYLPFHFFTFLISSLIESPNSADHNKVSETLATYVSRFKQTGLKRSNQRWVQLELLRRGKTIKEISSGILQINSGQKARFIRGTVTDQVPTLLAEIQADKVATARLLRLHGIPTVTHKRVYDLNNALDAADQLGYPIVLKPYNGAQDRHVHVNIKGADELIHACTRTNFPIEDGLIEVFIEGPIYRIFMVRNSIVYCSFKQHEYIEGDDNRTIRQLIQAHCDKTFKTKHKLKAKLDYDHVVTKNKIQERLVAENKSESTVLAHGQKFRITRIPGMSSGSIVHYIDTGDLPAIFIQQLNCISNLFAGAPIGIDAIGQSLEEVKFNEVNIGPQLSYTTGTYYQHFLDAEFP